MKPIDEIEKEYGIDPKAIELYDGAILKLPNLIDEEIEYVVLKKDFCGDYFYEVR